MDKEFERELDLIISEGTESNDVTARDQWIMITLATVPIILATIWYFQFNNG
jgi:hypothetical protein